MANYWHQAERSCIGVLVRWRWRCANGALVVWCVLACGVVWCGVCCGVLVVQLVLTCLTTVLTNMMRLTLFSES